MDFTKAQKLAIDLRDRNILVSAAAGSGKTATLTERIIRLLTDKDNPADITSMLIVTFTRAAAGELRTRISRELGKALVSDPSNKHLARQITALGSASICTIDSYYLDLVKSNFQKLDIPSKFRLADETELAILRKEIMDAIIERRYASDDDFCKFADEITSANGEYQLSEILLDLYKKTNSLPDGTDFLETSIERYKQDAELDFFETPVGQLMYQSIRDEVKYLIKRADRLIAMIDGEPNAAPYGKAISCDRDYLSQLDLKLDAKSYASAREMIFDYSPLDLGSVTSKNKNEVTEEIKLERNAIKKTLQDYRDREFLVHPDDIPLICQKSSNLANKAKELIDDFISAYNTEKSSRSICEFSDLRRYALKLLIDEDGKPTRTAIEEQKKFKHIFVDEYQDTDAIQDLVFRTISNGHNLFFVGDIKQSIYSFRGAEPSVFSGYRKSYLPAEGRADIPEIPLSVFMSENFRCSPNIISFTNAVCSYLFRESECEGGGIGYVAEDDLISLRPAPVCDDKVKIVLLEDDPSKDIQGEYIISEIKSILSSRSKPNGEPYLPRDIAILTRTNKDASKIADYLAKAGIPHANSAGNDLFENSEVLLMLSLLSTADNPQRDIPLAAVLRSPIFGFDLGDLVNVRAGRTTHSLYDAMSQCAGDESCEKSLRHKCMAAIEKIDYYRAEAEAMPVHLFMRFLWKDTNALTYAGSDEDSQKRTPFERRRNLRKFYEYARRYEASSYKGLHDFVEYINGIIAQNTRISDEDAVTDDTVQIMTVHKSKGLEFPTVFLYGCEKSINEQDSRKNVIFTHTTSPGIAFKVTDNSGFGLLDSPYRIALGDRISARSSEEEIRILYVALTRARDSLYVVASGKSDFAYKRLSTALSRASLGGRLTVLQSTSWLDRILLGLASDTTNTSYEIVTPSIDIAKDLKIDAEIKKSLDETKICDIYKKIKSSLDFKYPYFDYSDIPAKVSVSRLYPELLNENSDIVDIIQKADSMESRKPRFLGGEENAADKGTATHLFMQFCDFSNIQATLESVQEEIARLVSERYIPQKVADLIRVNEIAKFASTDFFKQIVSSKKMYRELRFNIFLPASEFTTDISKRSALAEEQILVQGVIDLCFINPKGDLVLCDYKTDRIPREIITNRERTTDFLFERHGQQLKYYAKAIEAMMGKAPDKVYIYSLCFGDALEIKL